MPESKTPDMERTRKRVLADYKNGRKPKELSEKYGVKVTTIKSWISRAKKATKAKKDAKKQEKSEAPKRRRGASVGNSNAVGKSSGAPCGNSNALIHGGYSPAYWDTLTDNEKALLENGASDAETLLREEIDLLSIRERRVMQRILEYSEAKGGQLFESVVRNEEKREFDSPEDKALYEDIQRSKIESGNLLPGHKYNVTTRTEAAHNVIHRLEEALTRIQAQRQRCVHSLMELQEAKLSQSEIEDLDRVEEVIYGGGQHQETPDNPV